MPLASANIGNGILIEFAAYLDRRNASFDRLRAAAGLDRIDADDVKQAFPLNGVVALFDRAAVALDDPCLGLRFAREIRTGSSGLIGHLVMNAPTLRAAVECAVKYFPTFVTDFNVRVSWGCDPFEIEWSYPRSIVAPRSQFNLFLAASAVRWLRLAAGERWHPVTLHLEEAEPPCHEVVQAQLGSRVVFAAPRNAIALEAALLERPMPSANAQLFSFLVELAEKWMKEGAHLPGIVGMVRGQVLSRLRSGGLELDQIAERLGLTPRSLQWRLEQAGTTFEKVRDDTRRDLAEHFLSDTDLPMVEIALELGFSEQSAFTRAAQRWFDLPPKGYRRMVRKAREASAADATGRRP